LVHFVVQKIRIILLKLKLVSMTYASKKEEENSTVGTNRFMHNFILLNYFLINIILLCFVYYYLNSLKMQFVNAKDRYS
jgi:hypothetical protein